MRRLLYAAEVVGLILFLPILVVAAAVAGATYELEDDRLGRTPWGDAQDLRR